MLVIFLFIFVRARYNRIVGGVVGLLALLQGAAVVTAFINETWDWVLVRLQALIAGAGSD